MAAANRTTTQATLDKSLIADAIPTPTVVLPDEPFGGSHAPDCPYRIKGECLCWRSDPDENPDAVEDTIADASEPYRQVQRDTQGLSDPWHCQNCGHKDQEVEFLPSDGDPAPYVCPECGSTECFIVTAD